jgi:hypothetical protein
LIWGRKTKDFGLNGSKHSLNSNYSWFHHECHSEFCVAHKYLNFAIFSYDSLAILIFWFCPEFILVHEIFKSFQNFRNISLNTIWHIRSHSWY